jgi:Zn-dependent protease/CBS domain-containing protein
VDESLRLGRIAGIPVGVNWSLLLVFWLITWGLAGNQLPDQLPGHSTGAYWATATMTAVLFYASLLAHELGHALVARSKGVTVEGITLWLFGGVAKLDREATSARDELRIALVGPAVSVAVAILHGLLAVGLDAAGAHELAVGAFAWLAAINVVLALFNLVPAAPLDGGRVLRAVLWRRWGDPIRSSVVASRAGRAFGYALIVLGLFEFAAGGGVGGLWLVFLGWFLLNAARAEEQHVLLRGALGHLRVRDVMTPDPVVGPDAVTVEAFLEEHVLRRRYSAFPLVDAGGRLTGLVTLGRLRRVPAERRATTPVGAVACPVAEALVVRPGEPLVDVLPRLSGSEDGRALVLDGDRLVGILSRSDVARAVELAALRRPAP